MAIDLSPTTQDALSLIVQNYNAGLDPALQLNDTDFVFDPPTVNTDVASSRNTRLRAKPTATSGKYGRVTIYYNRIDFGAFSDKPVVKRGTATKYSDIVPLLNDYFGINIVTADYTDATLPVANGDTTLNAKSTSLMFLGGLTFTLAAGTPTSIGPAGT